MSQPFIGEIRMFAGNFAPAGWAFCSGQLLSIAENEALFNLIGTTYGGDGQETFALPDLQSRIPIHQGTAVSSGISYVLGETGGVEQVTLTAQQMPAHRHPLASAGSPTSGSPAGHAFGAPAALKLYTEADGIADLEGNQQAGGSQPHDNMMPCLAVSFIISLFGIFPSQS
jgi:microcystin-dependent protein